MAQIISCENGKPKTQRNHAMFHCEHFYIYRDRCIIILLLLSGDSLWFQKDMQFGTKDADNDNSGFVCANEYLGAWWYNSCHYSNLNGHYFHEDETPGVANGVVWQSWLGYNKSLKKTTMKVRPEVFTPPGRTSKYIC